MFPNITSLRTRYATGADTRITPSPIIWKHYDPERFQLDYDDFRNFDGSVSGGVGTYRSAAGGYVSYEDTGDSIAALATEHNGVIQLATAATDNNQCVLQYGSDTNVQTELSRGVTTADTDKIVLFESRIRLPAVADGQRIFVGLTQEGQAANNFFADADGALADIDYIGFKIDEGDGDAMKVMYQKNGQADQTVGTFSTSLVAATWYKFGFVYNPSNPDDEKIEFYMDGGDLGSYVTLTNMAAATFADEEELQVHIGVGASAATAFKLDVDWWALATQL